MPAAVSRAVDPPRRESVSRVGRGGIRAGTRGRSAGTALPGCDGSVSRPPPRPRPRRPPWGGGAACPRGVPAAEVGARRGRGFHLRRACRRASRGQLRAFDVPLKRHCPRPAGTIRAGAGGRARHGRGCGHGGAPDPNGDGRGGTGTPPGPLNGDGDTGTSCTEWGQRRGAQAPPKEERDGGVGTPGGCGDTGNPVPNKDRGAGHGDQPLPPNRNTERGARAPPECTRGPGHPCPLTGTERGAWAPSHAPKR